MLKQVQHDSEAAIDIPIPFSYSNYMGFIKNVFDFVRYPTHSRTMGILIFFVLIAAVSLTVIVAQKQQRLRQRAESPEVCTAINNIPPCDFDFQTKPCSRLGQKCIDRSNIVFDVDSNSTVVFECQEE